MSGMQGPAQHHGASVIQQFRPSLSTTMNTQNPPDNVSTATRRQPLRSRLTGLKGILHDISNDSGQGSLKVAAVELAGFCTGRALFAACAGTRQVNRIQMKDKDTCTCWMTRSLVMNWADWIIRRGLFAAPASTCQTQMKDKERKHMHMSDAFPPNRPPAHPPPGPPSGVMTNNVRVGPLKRVLTKNDAAAQQKQQ